MPASSFDLQAHLTGYLHDYVCHVIVEGTSFRARRLLQKGHRLLLHWESGHCDQLFSHNVRPVCVSLFSWSVSLLQLLLSRTRRNKQATSDMNKQSHATAYVTLI